MNFPFFVARRYLFSKKKTHAINVISLISVIGVAVATMALVIVLSVFNGFHDLVASFFTNFDPQLKVVPVEGKTVPADDPILTKISHFPEVDVATGTVEDMALAIYNGKQAMVTIKGVDDNFPQLTHIWRRPIPAPYGQLAVWYSGHPSGSDLGLGSQLERVSQDLCAAA